MCGYILLDSHPKLARVCNACACSQFQQQQQQGHCHKCFVYVMFDNFRISFYPEMGTPHTLLHWLRVPLPCSTCCPTKNVRCLENEAWEKKVYFFFCFLTHVLQRAADIVPFVVLARLSGVAIEPLDPPCSNWQNFWLLPSEHIPRVVVVPCRPQSCYEKN